MTRPTVSEAWDAFSAELERRVDGNWRRFHNDMVFHDDVLFYAYKFRPMPMSPPTPDPLPHPFVLLKGFTQCYECGHVEADPVHT